MRSLRDRLKSYKQDQLRDEVAATIETFVQEDAAVAERLPDHALDHVMPGQERETPYGRCWYRDVRFDVLSAHGHYPLARTRHVPVDGLLKVCKIKGLADDDRLRWEDICFFDTETTGLGSGAGNFIFLFGIGWYEEDEFVVRQYFLRNYAEERAVLWALGEQLATFRAMVSFNGKGFDWKLLETRFTLARLALAPVLHIDLLPPARRLWKKVLVNCKLTTLEQDVLGFARVDDTPGSLAPELYFAYQTDGDARPLAGICTHNVHDILTLVTLSCHIGQMIAEPIAQATHPQELFGLSRWYEEWAQRDVTEACLVQVTAMEREESQQAREAVWQLSLLYKRQGRHHEAALLWHDLLDGGGMWQTAPRIELAKYYEHKVREWEQALVMTEETIELLQERKLLLRSLPIDHELTELARRRDRLLRKLARE